MASLLENAPAEVTKLGRELITGHYPELDDANVTIGYLFARPAQTTRGQVIAGKVKKTSVEQRLKGLPDCLIIIDGDGWDQWTEEKRRGLLDHELYHIEVCKDNAGQIKYDEAERPKLRMKNHDFEIVGFTEIIERNGEHAIETQELAKWGKKFEAVTQKCFWG